jgi:hypothetical protein
VLGETMGQLCHDNHEDQVEEQLEEADPAIGGAIGVSGRREPETSCS